MWLSAGTHGYDNQNGNNPVGLLIIGMGIGIITNQMLMSLYNCPEQCCFWIAFCHLTYHVPVFTRTCLYWDGLYKCMDGANCV